MSEWPVERDGHKYQPLPETWLGHPHACDSEKVGPRCLAVSCEIRGGRILRVRYAHPVSGNVVETVGGAASISGGDGYGPVGLVNATGWLRSFVPSPGDPTDTIRSCERDHLQSLWSERLTDLDWDYERDQLDEDPEKRLVADGGQPVDGTDRVSRQSVRTDSMLERAEGRKYHWCCSRGQPMVGIWGICPPHFVKLTRHVIKVVKADEPLAEPKAIGEDVEQLVFDAVDGLCTAVDSEDWYDAYADTTIGPRRTPIVEPAALNQEYLLSESPNRSSKGFVRV